MCGSSSKVEGQELWCCGVVRLLGVYSVKVPRQHFDIMSSRRYSNIIVNMLAIFVAPWGKSQ